MKYYQTLRFQLSVVLCLCFLGLVAFFVVYQGFDITWFLPITAYFLLGLIITGFVMTRLSLDIRTSTRQVNNLITGNYNQAYHFSSQHELSQLHDALFTLEQNIESTHDKLENQRNRLSGILTYMTDGVIATDRRGKVVLVNSAALEMLNASEGRLLRQKMIDVLDLSDRYTFRQLLEQHPEIIIDRANSHGEFISIKLQFALFRKESGFISGIVAVLHDVTEQETAERERRLFVANVSHELRTPLTSIKSYLEALDDGALTDMEVAPNFVAVSLEETNRMIRMIHELLLLSRMDGNDTQLDKEIVNLVAFLHFEINRFDQMLSKGDIDKQFKIIRQFPIKPIWAELDTDKMRQVIDNLLNNAIKYSPDGGNITVNLETSSTQILIKITDQGLGIPKKDLPKIFDRFYRVDKARTRKAGGTGLGLAIVREIVKLHDGFVWAKSDGKQGTTFTIILPYTELKHSATEIEDDWE